MTEQKAAASLWEQIFGDTRGLLHIFTGERNGDKLIDETIRMNNFKYPEARETAATWAIEKSNEGREAYFATHLLTRPKRVKENAAAIRALWSDLDGCDIPNGTLSPGVVVESSPGKFHAYWVLTDPIPPEVAEDLNRRLAHKIGADSSGFDLSQLLRVPGTTNHKYENRPTVSLVEVSDIRYSPRELDETLPRIEEAEPPHEREEDEEEPPVLLSGKSLEIWQGKHPKLTEDGDVDRSATLLKIGRVLYDAGAQRRVVVAALEERDETLGYRKYSDRKNDRKYYEDIFKKLEENGRNRRAGTDSSDSSDSFSSNIKIKPFPVEALPKACADFVREAAASLNCAPELVGIPVLGALSGAIGHSRSLQIKVGWDVSACLYAVVVDLPGSKKSPAQRLALKPIEKLQAKLRKEYKKKKLDYEEKMRAHAADKKKAAKAHQPEPEPPTRPKMQRIIVDDITVESLAVRLEENPRGVLSAHDELTGFIRGLDQYKSSGKGNARQAYLKMWANASIYIDRKTSDEPIVVPNPFVTLQGAIQPAVLAELPGGRNDGFLDRFFFAYPESRQGGYSERTVSATTDIDYREVIENLWKLKGGEDEDGLPTPSRVTMSPGAKKLFVKAANELAREAHTAGFPLVLRGPWAKFDTQLARLALIIYLARSAEAGTEENYLLAEDMRNALRLLDYFKTAARKVYGQLYEATSDDVLAADLRTFLTATGYVFRGTVSGLLENLDSSVLPDSAESLGRALVRIAKASPDISLRRHSTGKKRVILLTLKKLSEPSEPSDSPYSSGSEADSFSDGFKNCQSEPSGEGEALCPPTVVKVRQDKTAPFDEYIGDEYKHRETKEVVYEKSIWANRHKDAYHRGEITLEECLEMYEADIRSCPDLMAKIPTLAGKRLGCWCKPKKCHGDVLVKLFKELCGDEDGDVLWMN